MYVIIFPTHHCITIDRVGSQHPYDHDSIGCSRLQSTIAREQKGLPPRERPYLLFYSYAHHCDSALSPVVISYFNHRFCTCRRSAIQQITPSSNVFCRPTPSFYLRFGLLEAIIFRLYRRILLRYSCNAGSNSTVCGRGVGLLWNLPQGCLTWETKQNS